MSKKHNFPKAQDPESENLFDDSYTEGSWQSLANITFAGDEDTLAPDPSRNENDDQPDHPHDEDQPNQSHNEASPDNDEPTDFDDIANMFVHNSTGSEAFDAQDKTAPDAAHEFEEFTIVDNTSESETSETLHDRETEAKLAGGYLGRLETELDKTKSPGERLELEKIRGIAREYFMRATTSKEALIDPDEMISDIRDGYDALAKMYTTDYSKRAIASEYAYLANLCSEFANRYNNYADTNGREHPTTAPSAESTKPSETTKLSPDALSSDLIV